MGNSQAGGKAQSQADQTAEAQYQLTYASVQIKSNISSLQRQIAKMHAQIQQSIAANDEDIVKMLIQQKVDMERQAKEAQILLIRLQQVNNQIKNVNTQKQASQLLNTIVTPVLSQSLSQNDLEKIITEGNKFVNAFDRFNAQQQLLQGTMEGLNSTSMNSQKVQDEYQKYYMEGLISKGVNIEALPKEKQSEQTAPQTQENQLNDQFYERLRNRQQF